MSHNRFITTLYIDAATTMHCLGHYSWVSFGVNMLYEMELRHVAINMLDISPTNNVFLPSQTKHVWIYSNFVLTVSLFYILLNYITLHVNSKFYYNLLLHLHRDTWITNNNRFLLIFAVHRSNCISKNQWWLVSLLP